MDARCVYGSALSFYCNTYKDKAVIVTSPRPGFVQGSGSKHIF